MLVSNAEAYLTRCRDGAFFAKLATKAGNYFGKKAPSLIIR